MGEIFISYASADRQRIQPIINFLEKMGWSVWWDRDIPLGRTFDDVIEEAIERSECMIVIWSKNSVHSNWVRTEAGEGERKGILVPVQIDDVIIPLAFRRIEAAQLADWDGSSNHPELENLFEAVSRYIKPSIANVGVLQTSNLSIVSETQTENNARSYRPVQNPVSEKPKTGLLIRTLWKPILLISVLWSLLGVGMSQLEISPTLSFPIARFLSVISTGFLLTLVFPKLQWKYIFFYSALGAVGGFLSALRYSTSNLSIAFTSIISQTSSLLIGGLLFGLFLHTAEPGIRLRQLLTSVISWIIILFAGSFLNSFALNTIYALTENFVLARIVTDFSWGIITGVTLILILLMIKKQWFEMV